VERVGQGGFDHLSRLSVLLPDDQTVKVRASVGEFGEGISSCALLLICCFYLSFFFFCIGFPISFQWNKTSWLLDLCPSGVSQIQ